MQRRRGRILLLVLVLAQAASPVAWGQSQQPSQPSPPTAPSPSKPLCPPDVGPSAPTVGSGQRGSNLSDQLAQSGGIICPPAAADPEMSVPPKDTTGRTPVIPPPGTPGGDEYVQPK